MRRFSKMLQLCAATVSGLLLGQAVFAQEYPNTDQSRRDGTSWGLD